MLQRAYLERYALRLSPIFCWLIVQVAAAEPNGFLVLLVLTAGHITWVAVRAYVNPDQYQLHRVKLLVVPACALTAILFVRPAFDFFAGIVVLWQLYHYAAQNFGICRMYDAQTRSFHPLLRRLDRACSLAMTLAPYFATLSVLGGVRDFRHRMEGYLSGIVSLPLARVESAVTGLVPLWYGLFAATLVTYFVLHAWMHRQGHGFARKKMTFVAAYAGAVIAAWVTGGGDNAIMTITLIHTVQYFAIVYGSEQDHFARRIKGLGSRAGAATLIAAMTAAALVCGVATIYSVRATSSGADFSYLSGAVVWMNIMHFWIDGFVWKIRKPAPAVATTVSPSRSAA